MLKRLLTYCLLGMIILQSVLAMADVHQLHQLGTEHVVFDDAHLHDDGHADYSQQNPNLSPELSQLPTAEKWDCHHCCHCHGHLCPAILLSIERVQLAKSAAPLPDYVENAFPETYEPFLRPPKA